MISSAKQEPSFNLPTTLAENSKNFIYTLKFIENITTFSLSVLAIDIRCCSHWRRSLCGSRGAEAT